MPLKLSRRHKQGAWQITGTAAGRRIRQSAGTADKRLAEEIRAKLEAELFRGAVYGARAVITWAQACNSYCDVNPPSPHTSDYLRRLTLHFGPKLALKEIDQAAVDAACAALCQPDAAPATKLRNVITPLRAVLTHAARRDWCNPPMFETPKGAAGNKRTRWLTPDEYARLRDAASPHLRPLIVFLAGTGARLSEAITLEWRDVDLAHGRALLRDTKNGRDRLCDLPPAAVAAMSTIAERDGIVFRKRDGGAYPPNGQHSGGQIGTVWATACRRAGFAGAWQAGASGFRWWQPEDVTPHVLRHTWASWHYAVHKDLLRLKQDGDWSSVALVERYAKLTPPGMAPAILAAWGMGGMRLEAVA